MPWRGIYWAVRYREGYIRYRVGNAIFPVRGDRRPARICEALTNGIYLRYNSCRMNTLRASVEEKEVKQSGRFLVPARPGAGGRPFLLEV